MKWTKANLRLKIDMARCEGVAEGMRQATEKFEQETVDRLREQRIKMLEALAQALTAFAHITEEVGTMTRRNM